MTINTPKMMSRLPTITYIALVLPILINEAIPNTTLNTVVPMKTNIKDDCRIVELMLCMTDIPFSTGSLASDCMTKAEKAKNTPARRPAPTADA
ncbi:hypothetical protein J31TS3_15450 [Paenibacillus lactis]|nr:hypothetical protein J31TS3_15450 [Paenibacillus lactis]